MDGGALELSGNGHLAGISALHLTNGGVLVLDNSAVVQTDRIRDAAPVRMRGGDLVWTHTAAGWVDYSESFGDLKLLAGINRIAADRAAADGSSELTFESVERQGTAILRVEAPGLGEDLRNRIYSFTPPTTANGAVPWMLLKTGETGTGADWHLADYDTTDGVRASSYNAGDQSSWAGSHNARPAATQTMNGNRSLNALALDDGVFVTATGADRILSLDAPAGAALIVQTGGNSASTNTGTDEVVLQFGANTGLFHILGTSASIAMDRTSASAAPTGWSRRGPARSSGTPHRRPTTRHP